MEKAASKTITKKYSGRIIDFLWDGKIDVEVRIDGKFADNFAVTPKEDNPDVEGDFKARAQEYIGSLKKGESIILFDLL